MPKRTNDFQQLIFVIENKLAGSDATVTESSERIDVVTGQKREIDILIEAKISEIPIAIAIECRDHKNRKQTVTWIEELNGKYKDIPAIDKVIAVSKSGFSQAALAKAKQYGLEALTLTEAKDLDWESELKIAVSMTINVACDPMIKNIFLIANFHPNSACSSEQMLSITPELLSGKVIESFGDFDGNLAKYLNEFKEQIELLDKANILAKELAVKCEHLELTKNLIHLTHCPFIYSYDPQNFKMEFNAIGFLLSFRKKHFVFPLDKYAYRNVLVAEGNTESDSSDRIRLLQTPNDEGGYLAHGILELILKNFSDTPGLPLDIDFVKLLEEYTVQASVGE
jgi:hypothetical protein